MVAVLSYGLKAETVCEQRIKAAVAQAIGGGAVYSIILLPVIDENTQSTVPYLIDVINQVTSDRSQYSLLLSETCQVVGVPTLAL